MATQWQTFPIEFRGGLISNQSPLQQGTNAVGSATLLQNFEPNKEGGYSKIKGFEKFDTNTVPGSDAILALKIIDETKVVAARKTAANKTAYFLSSGNGWSTAKATSVTGSGGKARHTEANLDGNVKVVFVDGVNYPGIYNTGDDTMSFLSSSDSSDVAAAEHVAFFKSTAFYAKGNDIFFTAPFTLDDFAAANGAGSINVGASVTGLTVFRDQLIIFTTDSIKRLTGNTSADFQLTPITDRIGCVNGDTIQEVGGDIMYLAPDGIRLLSATDRIGDFGLDVASDTIAKTARNFVRTSSNYSSLLLRDKAQYRIFSYSSSEQASSASGLIATKFVAQGGTGLGWATTKGIKAHVADSAYVGDTNRAMFANEDGYIYELDKGSDFDGSDIDALYKSPFMPISDPEVRKTFYKLTLYVQPTGSMDLTAAIELDFGTDSNTAIVQPASFKITGTGTSVFTYGDSNSLYNTATYGGELDFVYDNSLVGSGKTVALRIEDKSTNPTFTLDTALLEFRQNDRQ